MRSIIHQMMINKVMRNSVGLVQHKSDLQRTDIERKVSSSITYAGWEISRIIKLTIQYIQ